MQLINRKKKLGLYCLIFAPMHYVAAWGLCCTGIIQSYRENRVASGKYFPLMRFWSNSMAWGPGCAMKILSALVLLGFFRTVLTTTVEFLDVGDLRATLYYQSRLYAQLSKLGPLKMLRYVWSCPFFLISFLSIANSHLFRECTDHQILWWFWRMSISMLSFLIPLYSRFSWPSNEST